MGLEVADDNSFEVTFTVGECHESQGYFGCVLIAQLYDCQHHWMQRKDARNLDCIETSPQDERLRCQRGRGGS